MTDRARVELAKHVLDKEIVDGGGLRCGKVDDIAIDVPDDGSPPVVVAVVTGPLAFATTIGKPAARVARLLHRVLGERAPRPVTVAWRHVARIDVAVHLDLDSADTELQSVQRHARRLVSWIPGS